jgi:hypothetical protein
MTYRGAARALVSNLVLVEPVGGRSPDMPSAVLFALALYAAAGAVTALAFVSVGLSQVLNPPMPATLGARILFLPAAFALWPYILIRWWKARSRA